MGLTPRSRRARILAVLATLGAAACGRVGFAPASGDTDAASGGRFDGAPVGADNGSGDLRGDAPDPGDEDAPPPLVLSPPALVSRPGSAHTLAASGGVPPYAWTLRSNASGATLSPSGLYMAGPTAGVTDLVEVTDARQASAQTAVEVVAWWHDAWGERIWLIVDHPVLTEPLADFPVPVFLNPSRIRYADTGPGGLDLRFVADDQATALRYDVEVWDATGDSLVWVKLPLASASMRFWLYYDNAGASIPSNAAEVWSANYQAVWHLAELGDGSPDEFRDATGHGLHARGGGGAVAETPTRISGQLGGAQELDGIDDFLAHDVSLPRTRGTLCHWLRADQWRSMVLFYEASDDSGGQDGFSDNGDILEIHSEVRSDGALGITYQDGWGSSGGSTGLASVRGGVAQIGTWQHVAFVWDLGQGRFDLFVDGELEGSTDVSGKTFTGKSAVFRAVGRTKDFVADRTWDGAVDEIRVATVPRSAAWIAVQVVAGNDALLTYGGQP